MTFIVTGGAGKRGRPLLFTDIGDRAVANTIFAEDEKLGWRTLGRRVESLGRKMEGGGFLFGSTRTRTRVTLDHALGSKESLDFVSKFGDIVIFLGKTKVRQGRYLQR